MVFFLPAPSPSCQLVAVPVAILLVALLMFSDVGLRYSFFCQYNIGLGHPPFS